MTWKRQVVVEAQWLVCTGKMHFDDQCGVLALIRLPLGWCESGHRQLLVILLDLKHWSVKYDSYFHAHCIHTCSV